MKKKKKQIQPWLDVDDKVLPDEILKAISKNWDQNTWDRYLNFHFDEKEDDRTEYADDSTLESLHFNSVEPAFLTGGEYVPARLKSQLKAAMKSLTFKQKFVVEKIFLKNLSEYQVAELLGISRGTVQEHKEVAIRHLKNNLHVDPSTFPISEGTRKLWSKKKVKDEEADL